MSDVASNECIAGNGSFVIIFVFNTILENEDKKTITYTRKL